jgi:hypothetical protein
MARMVPPTNFSPQTSPWQWRQRNEPHAHRQACQVGTQPERHPWNPRYREHNSWRRHYRDPKGPGAEAPRSGVHDVKLTPPFQAPVDSFRNTIKGLRSIAAQYAASDEAAKLCPVLGHREVTPSSGKEVSSDITIQDAEGIKGGKKRHKQRLQIVTPVAKDDGGNGKKVGGSDMVCIRTAICSGKH